MKKLLLTASVIISATTLFSSCDNGKYDAQPNTDLSNYVNPSNPKGGVFTGFDWGGTAPMSCEITGNYWQANDATFQTTTINSVDYIEVIGTKFGIPKTAFHLYFKASEMADNKEFSLNWVGDTYGGNYYADVDSVYFAVVDRPKYTFSSEGHAKEGRAKIISYDGLHIKGLFYMIPRNPNGYFINVQKGFFDITK